MKHIEMRTYVDDEPLTVLATGEQAEPDSPYWFCRSIQLFHRDSAPFDGDVSEDDKTRIIIEVERALDGAGRLYGN